MTICSERLDPPGVTVFSLVELLQRRAESVPERLAYRFLGNGETGESRMTYGELNLRARAIAACLQDMGACGERALLLYPAGLTYIEAFFGCLYAGVIAVPSPLPRLAFPRPLRASCPRQDPTVHLICHVPTSCSSCLVLSLQVWLQQRPMI